jgi:predicted nucleic acid-binding protein
MPLKLLIDTSVWLNLVKDYRHQPIISALEDLISSGEIELLVPQVVLDEFARNKERVVADAARSLKSHFSLVRDAVTRFGKAAAKDTTLKALDDVDHAAIIRGEAVNASIGRVEKLLTSVPAIPTTDAVKVRVTDRAITNQAPYHRSKNSAGDAILIELYTDQIAADRPTGTRFAFVTHNFQDFSEPTGDRKQPHPDLLPLFDGTSSVYSIDLIALINEIDEDLLADHDLQFNGFFEPRRLSEIMEAEHLLFRQVWYNRHWNTRTWIDRGEIQMLPKERYSMKPYRADQILDTVWEQALAAAKRTEDEVGIENLGPWDDFEWGMLNGKLSALRWVMGDEWDTLDT